MKQIKKKVLFVLCMLACLFSLSACSKEAEEASGLDPMMESNLKQQTVMLLEDLTSLSADQFTMVIDQNRAAGMEAVAVGLESYADLTDELGAYESCDEGKVKAASGGYEVTVNVVFEKRACVFTLNVSEDLYDITSIGFEPEYTLGENMAKAFMNMIMGMGTVFVVLIFISWLISCFKYINEFEKKSKKKTESPAPAPAPVQAAPAAEEDLTDDLELVAVITAAIAAAQGAQSSANGLVVRSIRRVPGSKWKRA